MGTKVSDTGGEGYTPAPTGVHRAICINYVDIGTHISEYQNQKKTQNKVCITWELPDEILEVDGEKKPFTATKFFTKSLHEKANLRADLVSWRGREFTQEELEGFDLDNILGVPCQLNIIHEPKQNGGIRAKIASILPLNKGMTVPSPSVTPWRYDMGEDGYNFPEQLSDGMKKLIEKSQEMTHANCLPGNPNSTEPMPEDTADYGVDDGIPF